MYSNLVNIRYLNVHKYLPSDIKIREADGLKAILQKVNDFLRILYVSFYQNWIQLNIGDIHSALLANVCWGIDYMR